MGYPFIFLCQLCSSSDHFCAYYAQFSFPLVCKNQSDFVARLQVFAIQYWLLNVLDEV